MLWKYIGPRRPGEEPGVRRVEGFPARDLKDSEVNEEQAVRLEASASWSKSAGGRKNDESEAD